jgi:hypothetical protein
MFTRKLRVVESPRYRRAFLLLITLFFAGCAAAPNRAELNDRQKSAQAMFDARCKTSGEKIYRTVDNVEGVYLMKLRPGPVNHGDQFRMDDPYGRDYVEEAYIMSFLRGFYVANVRLPENAENMRSFLPREYLFVEAIDPKDGNVYRYTGSRKVVRRMDSNAPNVKIDLQRDPNFDLNIYRYVLERTVVSKASAEYGVTYEDISTRQDRENWIAGSSLKVLDMRTGEVIAERIGYMMDWAHGSTAGGRSQWLFAANNACPEFTMFGYTNPRRASSYQTGQTQRFVQKVLRPKEEK